MRRKARSAPPRRRLQELRLDNQLSSGLKLKGPWFYLADYQMSRERVVNGACKFVKIITRWWFQMMFLFTSIWGKISILTNIFQMG